MIPVDIGHVYPKTGLDVDLRLDSTPTYTSSGSCYFDGDAGKVTISAAAGIDALFGAGGSISFWVKVASDGEGNYGRIFESGGWKLFVLGESGGNVQVRFDHNSGTNGEWVGPAASMTVGVWNHLALTYNGASIENDPVLYVNGQSLAVTESTKPVAPINADNADKILGSNSAGDRTFHGNICNAGVWKGTILTQAQVRSIMAANSYAGVQAVVQPTAYYLLSVDGDDSTGNYDGTIS